MESLLKPSDWFEKTWFSLWKAPDTRPISEWAAEHVKLPHSARKVKFDVSLTPYLELPLRMLQDNTYQVITCLGAVQSAKSTIAEVFACWAMSEDPGPLMWNFQSDPDAKEAAEMRVNKMFDACAPLAAKMPEGNARKTMSIVFDDGNWVLMQGATAKGNLQSKSVRYLLNDETWLYPVGHVAEADKRTTAYEWNRKVLNISTGALQGDETSELFEGATRHEFGFTCPKCKTWQIWIWGERGKQGGMKWDENEATRDKNGAWNYAEVLKSQRYECQHCDARYFDTPQDRRLLNSVSSYVQQNQNPEPARASCHWPAMVVPWIRWSTLLVEFLKATESARLGVMKPLQEFVQKRLAQAWEERQVEDKVTVSNSPYKMRELWPLMKRHFVTVDVQKDHFWVVGRMWAPDGSSRKSFAGRLELWEDIRNLQLELGVQDNCVLVDASYGPGAGGPRAVFFQCCMYGWTALMGDDRDFFKITYIEKNVRKTKLSLVSLPQRGDPLLGLKHSDAEYQKAHKLKMKTCLVIRWSNPGVKDILENLSRGRGASWEIPMDTPKEWHEHMKSEVKRIRPHRETGRPTVEYVLVGKRQAHLRDCECEQIVAAILAKLLADEEAQGGTPGDIEVKPEAIEEVVG